MRPSLKVMKVEEKLRPSRDEIFFKFRAQLRWLGSAWSLLESSLGPDCRIPSVRFDRRSGRQLGAVVGRPELDGRLWRTAAAVRRRRGRRLRLGSGHVLSVGHQLRRRWRGRSTALFTRLDSVLLELGNNLCCRLEMCFFFKICLLLI